ncbi:hypothetical protein GCM10010954_08670 [Halobacillus andaensis]|uniref:Uncharacterized protein n=1 Tax=Halobacillus andaensis TaxID=1176239 RepID=A0A917EVI5_HALAA|nr:hypothetical protein [Halobacillus andaensis]MBP2003656.1 hypothetical protein [Halobacillus andaensis]GGF12247.1 hypothetical protein GCM10010954_08670 [Halobacillus andaensis]
MSVWWYGSLGETKQIAGQDTDNFCTLNVIQLCEVCHKIVITCPSVEQRAVL